MLSKRVPVPIERELHMSLFSMRGRCALVVAAAGGAEQAGKGGECEEWSHRRPPLEWRRHYSGLLEEFPALTPGRRCAKTRTERFIPPLEQGRSRGFPFSLAGLNRRSP